MTPALRARILAAALADLATHPATTLFYSCREAARVLGIKVDDAEREVYAALPALLADGRIVRVGDCYGVGGGAGRSAA